MNVTLSLKEKCSQDATQMLYGNVMIAVVSSLLVSFTLFFTFYDGFEPQKVLWLISMNVVSFLRFMDSVSFNKAIKNDAVNYKYARKRSTIFVTLTAFIWSFYFIFLCNHTDIIEVLTNLIIIAGLTSGSLTVLAADKKNVIIFLSVLIYPLSIYLLLSGVFELRVLGGCAIAYSMVMLSLANRLANFTKKAIRLKNENAFLVEDMEEQVKERTTRIHLLSNTDSLTGLSNRNAFLSKLEKQLKHCKKQKKTLAVLFIDLDGFKAVNDNLGHDIGDQLLQQTGKRLLMLDDQPLTCRWGGDEFLISLLNYTEKEAINYAHHVVKTINKAHTIQNNRLSIGATIGIAFSPEHSKDKMHLIELADHAMYFQKKQKTSAVYVFSEELSNKIIREQSLKLRLNKAITNKELYLTFKKIECISTHKVVALEAVVSWRLNAEVIASQELVGIAEQHGHMQEIEYWSLFNACNIAEQLNLRELSIPINIKISKDYFQSKHLIENIKEILSSSTLPAELICLEIEEDVLNINEELTIERLRQLKALGLCLSISNFGACLASLTFLHQLGVNIIKIDKQHIEAFDDNTLIVIKTMQIISDTLHYKLVVQGIETEYEIKQLKNVGINLIQWGSIDKELDSGLLFEHLSEDGIQKNIFID